MAEHLDLQDWLAAADLRAAEVWEENGGALAFDPLRPELGVDHVFPDDEEEEDAAELARVRGLVFQNLMDFVWADGPCLLKAMKRLYVITRHGSPTHLAHMTQSDVAVLLNETRAATNAREMRVWEEFLASLGFFGTRRPLKKSDAARAKYAKAATGNVSRKGGRAAVRKISVLREQHPEQAKAKRRTNRRPKRKL